MKPTPKPCADCLQAREAPARTLFNPLCSYCGARALKMLDRMPVEPFAKRDRKRALMNDWLTFGHTEREIRRLYAEKALPLEPLQARGGPAAQTRTKPG